MDTKHPIFKHEMLTHDDKYNIIYSNDPSPQKYTRWLSRSYSGSNILSSHILCSSCQSDHPFLRYGNVNILPWKSNVRVMAGVKDQTHRGTMKLILADFADEKIEGSVKLLDIPGNLYITWHPEMAKTWCTKLWSEQFGENSSAVFFLNLSCNTLCEFSW